MPPGRSPRTFLTARAAPVRARMIGAFVFGEAVRGLPHEARGRAVRVGPLAGRRDDARAFAFRNTRTLPRVDYFSLGLDVYRERTYS